MSFHNVRLPTEIESGARGGLGFRTNILTNKAGFEQRNIEWERARGRWDISAGIRNKSDLIATKNFHKVRYGMAYGFLFKAPAVDEYLMERQTISVGPHEVTGSATIFPIFKEFDDDSGSVYRHYITRVIDGTFALWIGGALQGSSVGYGLDLDTGTITLNSSLGVGVILEFECQFYHPARFDIDRLDVQHLIELEELDDESLEGLSAIPIVSLRERVIGLGE